MPHDKTCNLMPGMPGGIRRVRFHAKPPLIPATLVHVQWAGLRVYLHASNSHCSRLARSLTAHRSSSPRRPSARPARPRRTSAHSWR
eukprot:6587327-Alexandrium_andersonii.AAC.1